MLILVPEALLEMYINLRPDIIRHREGGVHVHSTGELGLIRIGLG
jgi:hypothetical protein